MTRPSGNARRLIGSNPGVRWAGTARRRLAEAEVPRLCPSVLADAAAGFAGEDGSCLAAYKRRRATRRDVRRATLRDPIISYLQSSTW
jgi:hypothetical protein